MKPRVVIARRVFPAVIERLQTRFDVDANDADEVWPQAQLIQRLQGATGVLITSGERIDAPLLAACPALRAVCSMAVGHDNIDIAACSARGVLVSNAPGVLTETTADFGFALMMAAARRIGEAERFLRRGEWSRWGVDLFAGGDVHGSTLGVLGMGRIGQALARRGALGFGMAVRYHNRSRLPADMEAALGGARWVSLNDLLRQADHLVIVVPYSPSTHHLIGEAELGQMKSTATLTHIARGGVVDDAALAAALREGRIAAAALDVFEGEPAVHADLLALPNVVLTPHMASASAATRLAMAHLAADNLLAALGGPGGGSQAGQPPPTALNAAERVAHGKQVI